MKLHASLFQRRLNENILSICSSPCLILSLIEICKGHDAHTSYNEAESSVSKA